METRVFFRNPVGSSFRVIFGPRTRDAELNVGPLSGVGRSNGADQRVYVSTKRREKQTLQGSNNKQQK